MFEWAGTPYPQPGSGDVVYVAGSGEWAGQVRAAVEQINRQRVQGRARRLVQVRCPGHADGGSHLAGEVYATKWGPLLLGKAAFPLPWVARVEEAQARETAGAVPSRTRQASAPEPPAYLVKVAMQPRLELQARCGRLVAPLNDLRAATAAGRKIFIATEYSPSPLLAALFMVKWGIGPLGTKPKRAPA